MKHSHRITKAQLEDLLVSAKQSHAESEVIERLEWFLFYSECKSVSKTCTHFGIARTTLYRWFKRFDPRDLRTLQDQSTNPPSCLRSSYTPDVLPLYAGIELEKTPGKDKCIANTKSMHGSMYLPWVAVGAFCIQTIVLLLVGLYLLGDRPAENQIHASANEQIQSNVRFVDCTPLPDNTKITCTAIIDNEK